MLEKRIRKHIRLHAHMDPKEIYCLGETTSMASYYIQYILERIFNGHLEIASTGKKISTYTMDDWLSTRFEGILAQPQKIDVLAPLQVISSDELRLAGELLNLQGSSPAPSHSFIDKLHSIYPQTRSSLLKSFLYIDKLSDNEDKHT